MAPLLLQNGLFDNSQRKILQFQNGVFSSAEWILMFVKSQRIILLLQNGMFSTAEWFRRGFTTVRGLFYRCRMAPRKLQNAFLGFDAHLESTQASEKTCFDR
jgi:hypothetical protein